MNLKTVLLDLSKEVKKAYQAKEKLSVSRFNDPEASASELYILAERTLGKDFLTFEPEALWLSLEVAEVNRDKLLARISVATDTIFTEDYRVFGNVRLAFSGSTLTVDQVPKPEVSEIAWRVLEAELIQNLDQAVETILDDEVIGFIAASLHDQGFILATDLLEASQERLDNLTSPDALLLKPDVEKQWGKLGRSVNEQTSFEDSAVGVQLARLTEVRLYLVKRAIELTKRLSTL